MIHPIRRPDRFRTGARWSFLLAAALWAGIIVSYAVVRGCA